MKTNVCVFNKKASKLARQPKLFYNGQEVDYCTKYKYLGIFFFNTKNMFKAAREYLAEQANEAVFPANKYVKESVGKLSPKLQMKVFDCQILPILEYGSEIWSTGKEISVLERIQLKYLKNILSVKPQTSTLAVYGETGRFPLTVQQGINLLKYWCRIMNMENSSIVKNTYLELHKLLTAITHGAHLFNPFWVTLTSNYNKQLTAITHGAHLFNPFWVTMNWTISGTHSR